ncbi:endospore germination permease [Paenibacillus doosanensis]|uniref:GerAB/ArcD/ProY family transporter n=1 Tax=Paenibacillus doosanensis TaxID=1229154 RepID=UPI0021805B34|nr:endospore germination permease [Paenibacillus doosanensis]MCS7461265.1 endospore germination permease [Paenibacillus doosanensis]
MNSSNKISVLQMGMLLIMTVGLANHVTLIPLLLQTAKRDSWIAVIGAFALMVAWTWVPFVIIRKTGQTNLIEWLGSHIGPWFASIVRWTAALYLFSLAVISLRETTTWTKVTYLPQTPLIVIAACFMLLCWYTTNRGVQSIAISAGILLPFVVALGYFVMGANFQYKRYILLFPLFTNYGLDCPLHDLRRRGMIELIMILFMQHLLKGSVKWRHLLFLITVMAGLTPGPLMGSIAAFGPEQAAVLRYPAYEQWRLVTIGDYVAHVDFFSIYQWLSGSFIRISLSVFLTVEVLQIQSKQKRVITTNLLCLLLFIAGLLPVTDMTYIAYIHKYYSFTFFIVLFGSLLLAGLAVFKNKKKGRRL